MICPHCNKPLTPEQVASLLGSMTSLDLYNQIDYKTLVQIKKYIKKFKSSRKLSNHIYGNEFTLKSILFRVRNSKYKSDLLLKTLEEIESKL